MTDGSHRVLVIDDNPWIHDDVRKVLARDDDDGKLARLERELAGADADAIPPDRAAQLRFEIDSALQGKEGVEAVRRARGDGRPYAIAFVDIRMPPGWDGIETIERLWEVDPDVQAVICSAYSDYSWNAIQRRIGGTDRLLVLKKPFEAIEVAQLAHTLARKWSLQRVAHHRAEELEALVLAHASELARASRLTAGIAGELDGPTQDVTGSVQRLRSSFDELELARSSTAIPAAFDAAFGGLGRISRIVDAMKELGHDDRGEPAAVDLNRALLAMVEVARPEYRLVADLETDLGELPPVICAGSELHQVLLNLIVNAAHAIADAAEEAGGRGKIRVHTRTHGGEVLISVADTGPGAPERAGADPWRSLARAVVGRHGGSLTVEAELGRGTTVTVRLPAVGPRPDGRADAS